MTPAPRSARRSGISPPQPWTPSAGSLPAEARPDGGASTPLPGPPSLASGRQPHAGAPLQATASSTHGALASSS
eukprot:4749491-Alexandrium_andersonii.AAC.1